MNILLCHVRHDLNQDVSFFVLCLVTKSWLLREHTYCFFEESCELSGRLDSCLFVLGYALESGLLKTRGKVTVDSFEVDIFRAEVLPYNYA